MKILGRDVTWEKICRRLEGLRMHLYWYRFRKRLDLQNVKNRAFDVRYGTDTAEEILLTEAGVEPSEAQRGNTIYRAVWSEMFDQFIAALPVSPEGFTFIDYGSGKGKAMLLAADYPFEEIIGVEYAPGLHDVAIANCANYRGEKQRCHRLLPVLGDATTYEPPPRPLVCFFFNPFDGKTMLRVLDRLRLSHQTHPRQVFVCYMNPRSVAELGGALTTQHYFKPVKRSKRLLIYRAP